MADFWHGAAKRARKDFGYLPMGNSLLDERSSRIPWGEAAAFGGQLDCLKNVMGLRRDGYGIEQIGLGGGMIAGIDFFRDGGPSSFAADLQLLSKGSQMGLGSDFEKNGSLRLSNRREDNASMHSASSMLPRDASPTLYVEGIPIDCTPRETSHIFRPFVGFKEVRLVRKGANKPGGEFILCFVDFSDSRSASIALEALQGYKFDEMEPSSPALKLQFARIPGRHGGGNGDY